MGLNISVLTAREFVRRMEEQGIHRTTRYVPHFSTLIESMPEFSKREKRKINKRYKDKY